MNYDEIQAAARAFGQQNEQQTQGYQPGEAMPGFHQDASYQQAAQQAAMQVAKSQVPAQQFQQQPAYAPAPQQPVQQVPVQQQAPPPAPPEPQGVTQQPGWTPITNDTFQKAIAVFDNEFVAEDLRSEPVQKAIDQDATGFLNGITERLEQSVQSLAKAQNTRMSAQNIILLKAVEDIESLRSQVYEISRAPVGDPRGRRVMPQQPAPVAPMQKAFPSNVQGHEGQIPAPGQQFQPPQGPAMDNLTKGQINTGFTLLIQEAGQAHDENPNFATRARLDQVGVAAGSFPFTGEVSPVMKSEIYKALDGHGLLQVH